MWKVWYSDGSTFSDQDGAPDVAPKRDVQIIVTSSPLGARCVRQCDFYVWGRFDDELTWEGVDQWGLYDYLAEPGMKIVLFGRIIGIREYKRLMQVALDDPYVPFKAGFEQGEHPDSWGNNGVR